MFFLAFWMLSRGKMSYQLKSSSLQMSSSIWRMWKESLVLYLTVWFSLPVVFSFWLLSYLPLSFFLEGVIRVCGLVGVLLRALLSPPVLDENSIDRQLIDYKYDYQLKSAASLNRNNHYPIALRRNTCDHKCGLCRLIIIMEQQLSINNQLNINNERFILPGEPVALENAMLNQNHFYEESGESKSLYFGLLNLQNLGTKNYANVIKKVTTYMPQKNHFVVGIIKNRIGDNFIVDINAPVDGVLGGLQFDGATKRNKPNLNSGDLVFARVADFSKYLGAKLSCINLGYSAKNALGQLKAGTIIFGLSGKEKRVEEKIEIIKKYCQFEVAFGKNDVLWLSCSVPNTEMILYNIFVALLGGCSEEAFQSLLKMLHP